MINATSYEEFEELNGISLDSVLSVFEAVSAAFPLIISANLTKNTYTMIKDDGFLAYDMPATGNYDELIEKNVVNIHPSYQSTFLDNFKRENLVRKIKQGQNEVYLKLYQKGRTDEYQWVTTHVIHVQNHDGDICEICLNRQLPDEYGEMRTRFSGAPY